MNEKMTNSEIWAKILLLKYKPDTIKVLPKDDTEKLDNSQWIEPPNWPVDIAAAYELLEEMVGSTIAVSADTLPRAICLAWIAWKELRQENTRLR